MNNMEVAFMFIMGLALIVLNKAFARSMLNSTIGVKVNESDIVKLRIFSVIIGLAIIFFALFFIYLQWIETRR